MQELWSPTLDWDTPLPEPLRLRHQVWREDLELLADLELPRCYFAAEQAEEVCLHGFADASEKAFGAVIGRAKRAPHWGVQSRFRVIYVGMYVCLSWSKKRRRNYVGQTRACSKSVLGGKILPVTPVFLISTIRYSSFSMDGRETFT